MRAGWWLGYAILASGLTTAGKQVNVEFRNILQTGFVLAVLYIICNIGLSYLATWAQKRFAGEKKIEVTPAGVSLTR